MDFNHILQRRYSCRAFSAQGVEPEKVDRILEAGRIAPTAVNKQPVHIWAVSRPAALEGIKGVTRSNYGAPLILVVGSRPADAWVRRYDGKNGAEVDAAIVATHLMLATENEGLATLWVGSFDPALLREKDFVREDLARVRATTMEGSFGTQKEHYAMRRIKARMKMTEILYIFFGIHTANAVLLADRLEKQAQAKAA